jgi:superfamily II DNA or RNA helicase
VGVIGEYGGQRKNLSGIIDVAMMQSLSRGGEIPDFVKDYGLVIVDECHHVPAASFEAVLKHVNAKYVYGLTATPVREDGHHAILFLECGPIRYRVDAKSQAAKRPFDHFIVPRFTNLLPSSVREEAGIQQIFGDLSSNEARNEMIVCDVVSAITEGRKSLILTERTEHVFTLKKILELNCDNVIVLTGGMSAREKREANQRLSELDEDERFVIIATGKYVGEGFDFARLDTLFLAMPISWKGKVAQYTGRLHRLYQGKKDVIVYDYVDIHIPVLERMYYKRIRGYKAGGYKTIIKDVVGEQVNVIFGADDYWEAMCRDLESAAREIVISSPNITVKKVQAALPVLAGKMIGGAVITVITAPGNLKIENHKASIEDSVARLKETGVKVMEKKDVHQKFVVIDEKIVWYGSIHPLGYCKKHDNMMRIEGKEIAVSLLKQYYDNGEAAVRNIVERSVSSQIGIFE